MISRLITGFKNIFAKSQISDNRVYDVYDVGFHGDDHLIDVISYCINNSEQFIETGANVGSTIGYVMKKFPHITAFSCEPDKGAFRKAISHIGNRDKIEIYNYTSMEMLNYIVDKYQDMVKKETVFWLDAHGYGFKWSLREEIEFITNKFYRGYIFIDDFKVPDHDEFKWERYNDQECSFGYIKNSIKDNLRYALYYPGYQDKTSKHHPLTGWGMIEFGHDSAMSFPPSLEVFITCSS